MNKSLGEAFNLNHSAAETSGIDHLGGHQSAIASLESLFATPVVSKTGDKFLRCQLATDYTALVYVNHVTAVITVNIAEILAVPHMPNFVLGIYSWRGEIIWLLDLACQLGVSALSSLETGQTSYPVIIAQVAEQSFGLAVPQIFDIEEHDTKQLHPATPGLFAPQLQPFVKGYLAADRSTVLNPTAIISDSRLSTHAIDSSQLRICHESLPSL
jgi:positive phototaxis protein PixI